MMTFLLFIATVWVSLHLAMFVGCGLIFLFGKAWVAIVDNGRDLVHGIVGLVIIAAILAMGPIAWGLVLCVALYPVAHKLLGPARRPICRDLEPKL